MAQHKPSGLCRSVHQQMGCRECHREEPPHRNHRDCAGVFTSKWAAVNAIVKNHRIELDEFFSEEEIEKTSKRVLEAEARRRLRKELEFAYQTQGYETNYDIEVWNINEWYLTKY